MKTNILFNIAHAILGIIVGYLIYRFSGEQNFTTGLLSIAIGLLIIILLETIFHPYTARREFNELSARVNYLVDKLTDRLIPTNDIINILRHGSVRVPGTQTADVWIELIWSIKSRYWGILYVSPKEVAMTSLFERSLSVMAAKVHADQVDVKRIFLFAKKEDFEDSKKAMFACIKHGIQARYFFHCDLKSNPLLQKKLSHLQTLDFTIIDSHISWLTILDTHQFTRYGEAHFDTQLNEYYSEIFRMLWDASQPFSVKMV